MVKANLIVGNTSSILSLSRARKWIEDCESTHPSCESGRNVELPKRLVEIVSVLPGREPELKLVETEGLTGTYACLSHCWGQDLIAARTTSENINDFRRVIDWSLLPLNFQDAIIIAREFGISYLWIDSLCIIQNDRSDWERESANMAKIYEGGFITIAATASSSAAGGCFCSTQSDRCLRVEVGENHHFYIGIRDCTDVLHNKAPDAFLKTYPLFTRGWVYQERKLSRRILYCNRGELSFECGEVSLCECANRAIAPHLPQRLVGKQRAQRSKPEPYPRIPRGQFSRISDDQDLHNGWRRLVAEYTQLKLTYEMDMLPALSGLAKKTAEITGDIYLAGLWRKSLGDDLLWYVTQRGTSGGRVQKSKKDHEYWKPRPAWRAPSWSWASIDTGRGVEYSSFGAGTPSVPFDKNIKAAECVPAGQDPTGAVKTGFMRLITSLVPAYLRYICTHCRHNCAPNKRDIFVIETSDKFYAGPREERLQAMCRFDKMGLKVRDALPRYYSDTFHGTGDFTVPPLPDMRSKMKHCKLAPIFLLHISLKTHWNHQGVQEFFLALIKAVADQNEFQRIGLFVLQFRNIEQRNAWFNECWIPDLPLEEEIVLL